MSIVHEAICDHCGRLEGQVHQTPGLAQAAAKGKGWREIDAVGLLCRRCLKAEARKAKKKVPA